MKRLYFLVPTVESAKNIVQEVQGMGVTNNELGIYIIGKDHIKIEAAHLQEAGILQTTDVKHALVRGILFGGGVGLLVGIAAYIFQPIALYLGLGVVIGLTIFGVLFGAWVSTLIGVSIPNPIVEQNEKVLEAGGLLMLVDIPIEKEEAVTSLIRRHHPEAVIQGHLITPPSNTSDSVH